MQGYIWPIYFEDYADLTVIVEIDKSTKTGLGHCLTTKWGQYSGFNQSFPTTSDNITGHIPVGCGPVAVGQILYAHKYPQFFNWGGMVTGSYGNKVTSDFLYDVYLKCNAEYKEADNGKYGTSCSQKDRVAALKSYGYTCETLNETQITTAKLLTFSPSIVKSELIESDGTHSRHAWIIEGGEQRQSFIETQVWTFTYQDTFACIHTEDNLTDMSTLFYANWGWGGYGDGFYGFSLLKPDNSYQKNTIDGAIINIRPQNKQWL